MNEGNGTSIADAKRQIADEKTRRSKECGLKIEEVMKEYNCVLGAVPRIVDGKIEAVVVLTARDVEGA